jgi:hypothetical protein
VVLTRAAISKEEEWKRLGKEGGRKRRKSRAEEDTYLIKGEFFLDSQIGMLKQLRARQPSAL